MMFKQAILSSTLKTFKFKLGEIQQEHERILTNFEQSGGPYLHSIEPSELIS